MALKIDRVDTWAATLKDKPGELAGKLDTDIEILDVAFSRPGLSYTAAPT